MNSIDMRNGFVRNLEWEAKKQAQLDAIYENERRRLAPLPQTTSNTSSSNSSAAANNYNTARINALEQRCEKIEQRLDKLQDLMVDNNKLFVFAPESNINAGITLSLTDRQFRELMRKIMKP